MSTRKMASASMANLLIPLSGLLTSPFLSRELGPEGRGLYAAITLPIIVCGWLGTAGLQDALTYHLREGRLSRRAAATVSLVAAVPLGLLGVALLAAVGLFVFADDRGHYDQLLVLALFAPAHILANLLIGALTGESDILGVNLVKVVPALIRTVMVVIACLAFDLSAFWAGLLFLASVLAGLALGLARLLRAGPQEAARAEPGVPVRSLLAYSLMCLPGVLAGISTARLDQIIGLPVIGAKELGYYAVAVSVAEIPMVIGVAARTVLMGRSSAADRRLAARPARLATLASLVACASLAAAAPLAVPWVFGGAFAPAVLPTVILCAATVLYTSVVIMGAVLLADGRPGRSSAALVAGAVVGVVLLLVLAPFGAVGAAVASLAGYGVSLAVAVWAVVRNGPGWTPRMLTVPYADDIAAARDWMHRSPVVVRVVRLARGTGVGTIGAVVLLSLAWLRTVVPSLVEMFISGRPAFNAPDDVVPGVADVLGDAISLAFVAVAAALAAVGVLRGRPDRWPWLIVVLGPLVAITVAGLVNQQLPGLVTLALPLAAAAVWLCPPDPRALVAIGALGTASAVLSILMAVLRPDLGLISGEAAGDKSVLLGGLLAGPFLHSNVLGIGLALSLPFVFGVGSRLVRGGMLLVVFLAVAWTGARTAQLAVAAVLLVHLVIRYAPRRWRGGAWLLSAPVAAGFALVVAVPLLTRDPDGFTERGRIWQALLGRWADRPLLGWGPGVFDRPELADALGGRFTHGHNVLVHLLVVGGLLAAVLFAGLVVLAWRQSLAPARAGQPAPVLFLVALALVSLLEASHVSTTLTGYLTWLPLVLIVRLGPIRPAAPVGGGPAEPTQKMVVSRT
ncbi:O-antigen/teichoic acid export membrane protein/O-antigen ligase [Catenuloplanes nepalensis]|uniref:O-antigen/teichoic acid export membrane protein/O-antigen ligase n=1 Tax=Catenuloplanes nepalensis TaxID=587533 RepID=A0ABT9MY82_9ACTN|nr:O-antigen ligase family protein [Catenuloplanes nepalensis]MDP9796203.1 O-antigen/teichoic acid export membrane protein/O-antigen ligase [Catenuloplanes nepalensis]